MALFPGLWGRVLAVSADTMPGCGLVEFVPRATGGWIREIEFAEVRGDPAAETVER